MRSNRIYNKVLSAKAEGKKQLAVLIDPDKGTEKNWINYAQLAGEARVDYLFVGGTLLRPNQLERCLTVLKEFTDIPLLIFPGGSYQVSEHADALLYLSLISGRNAELLIGEQVKAAVALKDLPLEVISTGYMLVDGGKPTSVSYISNTLPIPGDKPDIAAATALAGELLGLKLIYLEAGSGADEPVPAEMIRTVQNATTCPLIVGGGMRDTSSLRKAYEAGADLVVVGTAFEHNPDLIIEMATVAREFQKITP